MIPNPIQSALATLRLDLMTRPPRLPDIDAAWRRHTVIDLDFGPVSVVSLEDLVATKKTQRDKDWATIGELVAADMIAHERSADRSRAAFWLRECRDADALIHLALEFREIAVTTMADRPLLHVALHGDRSALELELAREQIDGKQADREYWAPLRAELEQMRHDLRK